MSKKYHWMSLVTGEVTTTCGVFHAISEAIKYRKHYTDLPILKYALLWHFSLKGY